MKLEGVLCEQESSRVESTGFDPRRVGSDAKFKKDALTGVPRESSGFSRGVAKLNEFSLGKETASNGKPLKVRSAMGKVKRGRWRKPTATP